jgi:putative sigma-54 modulation protein
MTAHVDIHGRNLQISDRIDSYVGRRAGGLDRYLSDIEHVRVDLSHIKTARNANDRQSAQITVRGKKFILRSEERSDDVFAAFDRALDKIQRQISRYKGKRNRGRGDGASLGGLAVESSEYDDFDEDESTIARRKTFTISPMDEAEAVEQMQLLGHDTFFVFFNSENNKVNVVYRRRDGGYGVIDPEMS